MLNLLIVDDERITRDTLHNKINWSELNISDVREAQNGLEALEICKDFTPDICLCDVKMPKMNGIQLGYCLHDKFPDCKIIYLSGYAEKEDLKSAIDIHAVCYLEKPLSLSQVYEVINKTSASILINKQEKDRISKDQELLSYIHSQYTDEELDSILSGNNGDFKISSNNKLVQSAASFVSDNYQDCELSLDQIADSLFITKSYLCSLFKKETGQTINNYVTYVRIKAAMKMIKSEDVTVSEVSERVGMKDPNYFSTVFKKISGYTPSEYKGNCVNERLSL